MVTRGEFLFVSLKNIISQVPGKKAFQIRNITKIRPADLCSAKIKVQRYFSEQKVRIERFKDSPDHSHSIEDSEKLKRAKVVRELVIQEAVKNYRPPEIVSAVKEIVTEKLDLGECVKELRQKEVTNIKYKIRGPLDTHLVGNPKRELDIREAISFLENKDTWLNVMKFLTCPLTVLFLCIQIISKTLSNMAG